MSRRKSSRIAYNKMVPEDTFLGGYLSYMSPLETAHAFDFWSGLWCLSSAVGRDIFVDRPGAPVYLNVYAILVAESGITRKSTAVRHATSCLRGLTGDIPRLVETKTTPEKLSHILWKQSEEHGRSSAVISISELAIFLGREKYTETMPTLLTDLYDCPEIRDGGGTLGAGTQTLRNVFVSFLSASTPSWLLRTVNPDVIEGGFTSRVCFVVAEEPKRSSPWPEPLDDELRSRLISDLRRVQTKARDIGRIQLSDGAMRAFTKWYRGRTHYRDPFRASFQSREDAHVLRMAGLLSINDDTWVIQHHHILAAIKIVTQVREDGASIFEGTGANSRLIVGIDKIRDKLLAAGINGLPQRELTKAVAAYMNAEHMTAALDTMHNLGMVQKFEKVQVSRGRPTTIWRGLGPLQASNAIDKITSDFAPTRS